MTKQTFFSVLIAISGIKSILQKNICIAILAYTIFFYFALPSSLIIRENFWGFHIPKLKKDIKYKIYQNSWKKSKNEE